MGSWHQQKFWLGSQACLGNKASGSCGWFYMLQGGPLTGLRAPLKRVGVDIRQLEILAS